MAIEDFLLTFDVDRVRNAAGRYAAITPDLLEANREAAARIAASFQKLLREAAPFRSKNRRDASEQHFRDMIKNRVDQTGPYEFTGTVYVQEGADHEGTSAGQRLRWIVFGTRPHPIPLQPKTGGAWLFFFWERAGRNVRFRQVQHPGSGPNDFVARALAGGGAQLAAEVRALGNGLVQALTFEGFGD